MATMKWRIARFSLMALSTFVAGAGAIIVAAAAWTLKQELAELAELAEQNEVRS